MKRFFFLALVCLLFAGTSCEDDYRDVVLFTGAEPVYQSGTCSNLLTEAMLYLSSPEGLVVGIDGGDGNYQVSGNDKAIATAEFTESADGFQRFRIRPVGEGETVFTVTDGSGQQSMLKVTVQAYFKWEIKVLEIRYQYEGNALSDKEFFELADEISDVLTMKLNGRYVLRANDDSNPLYGGGILEVYPTSDSYEPIVGTYDMTDSAEAGACIRFKYGDEVHVFSSSPVALSPTLLSVTKETGPISVLYWEDVTMSSPQTLPDGEHIYRAEKWTTVSHR